MADPLSQLRAFHVAKKEIKEHNGYIIFGDHGWPASVKTNYLVCTSNRDGKKECYTLQSLLHFLKHTGISHHFYVKKSAEDNIPPVHRPDRKDLLLYLTGEINTSQNIDKSAAIPSNRVPTSEILKRSDGHADPSSSQSRVARNDSAQSGAAQGTSGDLSSHDQAAFSQAREAFAASLDEPKLKKPTISAPQTSASTTESVPSAVIAELGLDKVAAMRAKRLAVKRSTIVDTDAAIADKQSATDTTRKILYDYDQHLMEKIRMKERVYRTRSSILQSHTKNFAKSVLPLIQSITKMEEDPSKKVLPTSQGGATIVRSDMMSQSKTMAPQPSQPQTHYNRYDQERFAKSDAAKDFDIDTRRSYAHTALDAFKKSDAPDPQIAPVAQQPIQQPQRMPQIRAQPDPYPHNGNSANINRPARKKPRSSTPIIIIPATTTSLINMYNAKEIIQDLKFVEGKSGTSNQRASEVNIIRRKPDGGSPATYKIIDNPIKLEPEDWNRVVAVFVQGPSWQFKGWPWGGNPTDIFSRIKAFHLKFDEHKLDTNIANWNVQVIDLSRTRRHLDKANLLKFWSALDAYMMKYKKELKF